MWLDEDFICEVQTNIDRTEILFKVQENLKNREFFDLNLDKRRYIQLLFDCLRFDTKNLNLSAKKELAKQFL